MSNSPTSGRRDANSTSWSTGEQPASPPAAVDPAVWEEVLRRTSQSLGSEETISDADKQALADVARRYAGQPLTLEPIAAELVLACLQNQIQGLPGFAEFGRALAARIARTIMEDPEAGQRLAAFWNRLGGGLT